MAEGIRSYCIRASKMRKASDVWRVQEKCAEGNDVLWITNTAVCAAECTCFTIDKFSREFHSDTLYLYKITRHVDFISITTPTQLLSKPPCTSEGFNSSSPFPSFHHVYFNSLHKAKSLLSDNGTAVRYDGTAALD